MKEEVIRYRRERARETLEEAEIMLDNKKLFAAVNRIYYVIFYEVLALLLTKGLSSSKHSGVRSLFNKEFVKSGIISEEHGDFYNKISGFRQRGDYEDFVEFNIEEVKRWFDKAKDFINSVEQVIQKVVRDEKLNRDT
ncbi:MAG: HEPN domain-containing protein [Actinobacteria bacterium]|nr:HEPN domain-containing protein [Actinomycetota bacterium]